MKAIDKPLVLFLILGFILMTVLGTISHEYAHFSFARYLGYEASLHYSHTRWWPGDPDRIVSREDAFYITLGGPLQTSATGSTGLMFLYLFRKSYRRAVALSAVQWLCIFITLFWLRQPANFCVWLAESVWSNSFSRSGDEFEIARFIGWPEWSVISCTGMLGVAILGIVIWKFIPVVQRREFLLSGLIGGVVGYILWLHLLGRFILP